MSRYISELPTSALPLSGLEIILLNQNGVTVTTPLSAIKTYSVVNAPAIPRRKIAFCGDSITNGNSGRVAAVGAQAQYLARSWSGFTASILKHAIIPTKNNYPILGVGYEDYDFGTDGISIDQFMFFTVNEVSTGNNKWPGVAITPMRAAIDTNPDIFVVFLGTNNIISDSAATILDKLDSLLSVFETTGKLVFIAELLPRLNTSLDVGGSYQVKINAVNAGLPEVAANHGAIIIPWHNALALNGAPNPLYFNDEDGGAGTTYLHPNVAGCAKMGEVCAETLSIYVGEPYPIPIENSPAWLTSNAYCTSPTAPAAGAATGFTATGGSTASLVIDDDSIVWQQCSSALSGYVYNFAPSISLTTPLSALANSAIPIRSVCQYDILSGSCTSLRLATTVEYLTGGNIIATGHFTDINPSTEGIIENHAGMLMTPEFTIPTPSLSTTNYTTILARFSTPYTFRYRVFGNFKSPL
jgi:hypothetical protein